MVAIGGDEGVEPRPTPLSCALEFVCAARASTIIGVVALAAAPLDATAAACGEPTRLAELAVPLADPFNDVIEAVGDVPSREARGEPPTLATLPLALAATSAGSAVADADFVLSSTLGVAGERSRLRVESGEPGDSLADVEAILKAAIRLESARLCVSGRRRKS